MLRHRVAALALCATCALAGAAQDSSTSPAAVDPGSQARALQRERIQALVELWATADDERRESALSALRPDPARRPPPGSWPSFAALADAQRALRGGPGPAESGWWEQRLVDSFGLTVRPGAFEARPGSRGTPLTVLVAPLFDTPVPDAVDVRLIWVSPQGEELVARTEPVEPGPLRGGFEMFVRAPPSAPGEWALVPVVLRQGASLRGFPVAVDAVRDLERRRAALAERWPTSHPGAARAADASALVEGGLRLPALTSEDLLSLAEGEPAGQPIGGLVPARPHFVAGRLEAWRLGPSAAHVGVVLIASSRERPEELLAGVLGERWGAAARASGFEVVATGLPLLPAAGTRSALDLAAELRAAHGWERCALVALGEAALQSAAALGGAGASGFDPVVLLREAPGLARPDGRLGTSVLSLEPLAETSGSEDLRPEGPPWVRLTRREPRFLLELELPQLVAAVLREGPRAVLGDAPR